MKYNLYFSDNESLMAKVKELIEANVIFEVSTLKITVLKRPNVTVLYKTKEEAYKDIDIYSEYEGFRDIIMHLYENEEVQKLIQNECKILGIIKKNTYNTTAK